MTQNRRKFNRQPIQLSALVHPPAGRSWLCSIKDFCEEGMLLSGTSGGRSLEATGAQASGGDVVSVHFSVATPTGQEHYRTQAKIARIMDNGNGMGVFFETGLDGRAYQSLLDFAVAAGTTVPNDLPEVEELDDDMLDLAAEIPESAAGVGAKTDRSGPQAAKLKAAKPDAPMRDARISARDAEKLTARISAVTSALLLASPQDLLKPLAKN